MRLEYKQDQHGGIFVLEDTVPVSETEFTQVLTISLADWKLQGFKLAWLNLSLERLHLIPIAVKLGFVFHHALDTQTMLVYTLITDAYIPPYATHTSGAGAVVISPDNEVLLVQEHVRRNQYLLKLPGGMLEQHEHIADAVVREVLEETGVQTVFESILGLGQVHDWQFGKSNIYFVCKLRPLSFESKADGVEILKTLWMPLDDFFQSHVVSPFDKQIVFKTLKVQGLRLVHVEDVEISPERLELFLLAS